MTNCDETWKEYLAEIAKELGDGWYVSEYGNLRNPNKNFHFHVSKNRSDNKKARFASAHNGDGKEWGGITRTNWPNREEFPAFNVTISRGANAAAQVISRNLPEVQRLSAIVDIEREKEAQQAKNIAERVERLVNLSGGKLKEKANYPNCLETRGVPYLDRLEVYEHTTLVGTGYTSMPDWKAEAILRILMAESPEPSLQEAVVEWKKLKLDFEKLGEGENRLMQLIEAENKMMNLV